MSGKRLVLNKTIKSLTALREGDAAPKKSPGTLRLYSMRFCPFAQRTRLVLIHKQIPHEVVNINLKRRPKWFWQEKNPFSLVPVIEKDKMIIYESVACNDYLDEIYPHDKLNPMDLLERTKQKMLMESFSKVVSLFYQVINMKDDKQQVAKLLKRALSPYEAALSGKYFGGSNVSMLDLHIWPWFERLPIVSRVLEEDVFEGFPKIKKWKTIMEDLPCVQQTAFSLEDHAEFFSSFLTGEPNYDHALETEYIAKL
ncbi:DgyrCDS7537 [Dimorphilus gyrociliatus]|uniref:Glutathione S-transferase omega n=1 Tax=Dimorphilus gyrociliatus TaxID=2664684 RepID=A0A7I8VW97_9ANNE|nr:DgyrCDS7537 [Dimorphilus gyrociliatus]